MPFYVKLYHVMSGYFWLSVQVRIYYVRLDQDKPGYFRF
jgi:hypothetical protein